MYAVLDANNLVQNIIYDVSVFQMPPGWSTVPIPAGAQCAIGMTYSPATGVFA
jgi:hypothetical protein